MFCSNLKKKALSDHVPYTVSMKTEKDNYVFFSFNMMNKMEFIQGQGKDGKQWRYINNGFICIEEPHEPYQARLREVASRINSYAATHIDIVRPVAFFLQEGPVGEFYSYFRDELSYSSTETASYIDKNYNLLLAVKVNNSIMTLYDKQRYEYSKELTMKMNEVTLTAGLDNRILIAVLVNKETLNLTLTVNVHADFSKPIIDDVKAITDKARELGINDIIFCGDHNRNLTRINPTDRAKSDISKEGALVESKLYACNIESTSFIKRFDENSGLIFPNLPGSKDFFHAVEVETRDGVITSHPATLKAEVAMYFVKSSSYLYQQMNPSLVNIPDGFIKNMGKPLLASPVNTVTGQYKNGCNSSFT